MNKHLTKAEILYSQSRYELALKEAAVVIAKDPENILAHIMRSLCLSQLDKHKEAIESAREAIQLAPDYAHCHFVLALAFLGNSLARESEDAIREAIRLDPHDADYFGVLAGIQQAGSKWKESLASTDKGLSIDPKHINCINLHSIALTKLGRKNEAHASLDTALAHEPDNAMTHANKGWALLEHGKQEKAMKHFREALRIDASHERACEGIIETMKARHAIYRLFLGYTFWISRFSGRTQMGIWIVAIVAIQMISAIGKDYPAFESIAQGIVIIYMLFVLSTWIADPLFNLVLRLSKVGRLALSPGQIIATNWFGGFLITVLLFLTAGFAMQDSYLFIPAAVGVVFSIIIPKLFGREDDRKSSARMRYSVVAVVLGVALSTAAIIHSTHTPLLGMLFIFISVGYLWIANIVTISHN